jgi:hypothetical protein
MKALLTPFGITAAPLVLASAVINVEQVGTLREDWNTPDGTSRPATSGQAGTRKTR